MGILVWTPALTANGQRHAVQCKFFLAVCRELGIAKIFTTACHPQTNGQVERFNRNIINSLRGYVERMQNDWDEYLTPKERETVFTMLGKHRNMRDGRLGQVHTTAHRIQLTPGAKPAYSQPYRAGAKAREAESVEIQRMFRAGVI
jgi:transposase InsO family protein